MLLDVGFPLRTSQGEPWIKLVKKQAKWRFNLHNDLFQVFTKIHILKYTGTNQFRIVSDSLQLVCCSFLACFEDLLI